MAVGIRSLSLILDSLSHSFVLNLYTALFAMLVLLHALLVHTIRIRFLSNSKKRRTLEFIICPGIWTGWWQIISTKCYSYILLHVCKWVNNAAVHKIIHNVVYTLHYTYINTDTHWWNLSEMKIKWKKEEKNNNIRDM